MSGPSFSTFILALSKSVIASIAALGATATFTGFSHEQLQFPDALTVAIVYIGFTVVVSEGSKSFYLLKSLKHKV